ncbi:DUF2892 domain-containing protein [Paenibacillus sp. NEAU-GSW1]|uniref:YgaP family membrane protein n=1 Tax=Paenibacillus sp. NEAU-GSW1 TaxID=2682486 RepID=UPI0012E26B87|nr:DUF2892 domain-containing protein [Paenibacillus sp. NEAU-GSW1]MUT64692.1 DUF2892 domain-containing protein [Paenibacillus sp. NEAU-GSW1]
MKNVGGADRAMRWVLGIGLLSLFYFLDGYWKLLGVIAVIPLMTAITQFCFINKLLGRNTCEISKR